MFGLSFAGAFGLVLFIVLMYNVLKEWQGSVAIGNMMWSGSTGMIKALEIQ